MKHAAIAALWEAHSADILVEILGEILGENFRCTS